MKQLLLNRNEVLQGPSPRVIRALKDFEPEHASLYIEDYYGSILIPKLADIFSLPEEQIILSYGEEDFFRTVFDHLDPENDSVLTSALHYAYYDKYLKFKNIKLQTFKMIEEENEFTFDLEDAYKQYQTLKPKVIIIASPNNPTGNALAPQELENILHVVQPETLVIINEAYWGFHPEYNQSAFLSLLEKYPNLVFLRSFSKLYSLAGLRLGFVLTGEKVKESLNYQNRYLGLSRVLEEVAVAALSSEDYYQKIAEEITADREAFYNQAKKMKNFRPFISRGNFVPIKLEEKAIDPFQKALEKEKIIISKFVDKNLIRVTVGFARHTQNFLKFMQKIDRQ